MFRLVIPPEDLVLAALKVIELMLKNIKIKLGLKMIKILKDQNMFCFEIPSEELVLAALGYQTQLKEY